MRVSAWKSFLPTHRRSPMRIVIVIVRFDQDRRLALTGFCHYFRDLSCHQIPHGSGTDARPRSAQGTGVAD